MIRLASTAQAFEAIAVAMLLGSVNYEREHCQRRVFHLAQLAYRRQVVRGAAAGQGYQRRDLAAGSGKLIARGRLGQPKARVVLPIALSYTSPQRG
jgi:hypothetical protein